MEIKVTHNKSTNNTTSCRRNPWTIVPMFCGFLASLFLVKPKVQCQDISAPRFFDFSIRPISATNSPVIPSYPSVIQPQTAPNYQISTSLRFPVKIKGSTKIFGELKYKNEYINGFFSIENDRHEQLNLKQSKGSIILLSQLNEKWRFMNVVSADSRSTEFIATDDPNALRFRNISLFEKDLANGSVIGFGGSFAYDQNFTAIPIFKYQTTFAKDWNLELVLPRSVAVSKDLAKDSRLNFAVKGSSSNYSLGTKTIINDFAAETRYRRFDLTGLVGYQRQLTPWIGFKVEAGASMPLQSGIFAVDSNTELYRFNEGLSPYFKVGFFLSLPR